MRKQKINQFIQKYRLSGLINSVIWQVNKGVLSTSFMSDTKSLLGNVELRDFNQDDIEFGVHDTTKLKSMLGALGAEIDYRVIYKNKKLVSLEFKDESTTINFMVSNLSIIPKVSDLKKTPEFDVNLRFDENFMMKFIKAKSALPKERNFTFISKNQLHQIVLGYTSINSNKISMNLNGETKGDVSPISFSANYFKEILLANKDATDALLKISSEGLLHIHFKTEDYTTNYYLMKSID